MQNDIVKPPTQPTQPNQPEPNSLSNSLNNDVHMAPPADDAISSSVSTPASPAPPADAAAQAETQLTTAQKPRRKRPMAAIGTSVMVFVALAGGAIYMTLAEQNNQTEVSTITQAPAGQTTVDAAADIDTILDEAAELPTSNEDPSADLSDQNLGL